MDTLSELRHLVMAENIRCLRHICLCLLLSVPVGFWFMVAFSLRTGAIVSAICFVAATSLAVRSRNKEVRRVKAFVRFRSKHPANDEVVLQEG